MQTLAEAVAELKAKNYQAGTQANDALARADKLADEFADVRPKPVAMPLEQYFVTPTAG